MTTDRLMTPDGNFIDVVVPIPGVYLRPDCDVGKEMRRLFPMSHFPKLWEKYPEVFG